MVLKKLLSIVMPRDWTPDRLNLGKRRMYRWTGEAFEYRPMTESEWADAYVHWAIK